MSMNKIEWFIEAYKHHYELQMYNNKAFEWDVLEALNDFSQVVDLLYEYQDTLNIRLVDNIVERWYE